MREKREREESVWSALSVAGVWRVLRSVLVSCCACVLPAVTLFVWCVSLALCLRVSLCVLARVVALRGLRGTSVADTS